MKFKSTIDFFEKVKDGECSNLDQHNYIEKVTKQFKPVLISKLLYDLDFFIFNFTEELHSELSRERIDEEIERYRENGKPLPMKKTINLEYKIAEKKGLSTKNIQKYYDEVLDTETMFFVWDLYSIKMLKQRIIRLGKEHKNDTDPSQLNDLSDTIGTEKIIYLKELGILDYLKKLEPFINSTNALATVISAITGINSQTTQSYLNPIDNISVNQKNNPLNSKKKVEKVKQTLTNLGFNHSK